MSYSTLAKLNKAKLKAESDVSKAQFVHTHSPEQRLNQRTQVRTPVCEATISVKDF